MWRRVPSALEAAARAVGVQVVPAALRPIEISGSRPWQSRPCVSSAPPSCWATRKSGASHTALSTRSLNFRLENEDTSFCELLGRGRFQVAQQLLLGTRMSVISLALAVGYAETSAFDHAYQRWAGERPSEWRRSNSDESTT